MPLAWTRNSNEFLSEYIVHIDGRPLTCFLCKMVEARSKRMYDYIRKKFGKEIHAVGVAKGDKLEGECHEEKYPDYVKVIRAPIYYQGSFRTEMVAKLWDECKTACRRDKAILIHCNHSFHRGPCLLAAIMIKAGTAKAAAFDIIAQERTIYHGHFLDISEWPLQQQQHHATKKLIEVHEWLKDLESIEIYSVRTQDSPCDQSDCICFLKSSSKHSRVCWLMQCFDVEELHLAAVRKAAAELVSKNEENRNNQTKSSSSITASRLKPQPPKSSPPRSKSITNSSASNGKKRLRPGARSRSPLRRPESRQPPIPPWEKRTLR